MSLRTTGMLAAVIAAMLSGAARALEMPEAPPLLPAPNLLDVTQFRVENSQVPGTSIRQNMTVWQVRDGMWNGQVLSGLTLVLVEQASADGAGGRTLAAYVSHYASPAQRSALAAAISAAQPTHGMMKDLSSLRIEPAVIRMELEGQTVVVHLALIS